MADRISLDKNNITLNELFKKAEEWGKLPVAELTRDQVAIIDLKRSIAIKDDATGDKRSENACFICYTGA